MIPTETASPDEVIQLEQHYLHPRILDQLMVRTLELFGTERLHLYSVQLPPYLNISSYVVNGMSLIGEIILMYYYLSLF